MASCINKCTNSKRIIDWQCSPTLDTQFFYSDPHKSLLGRSLPITTPPMPLYVYTLTLQVCNNTSITNLDSNVRLRYWDRPDVWPSTLFSFFRTNYTTWPLLDSFSASNLDIGQPGRLVFHEFHSEHFLPIPPPFYSLSPRSFLKRKQIV